ncbi:AI-2E family transporter [Reinekea marina]|uniref:AI-2E family transporter n=2 Tax=Reinekea marina TaxID=1310421 RepID=A0ABV7WU21_9GAMM
MKVTDSQKWFILACLGLSIWLLSLLSPILGPFLTAILLAYMGDPIVDKLQTWKLSRTQGVVVTFLALTAVFVLAGLILVPALVEQIDQLIKLIPTLINYIKSTFIPMVEAKFGVELAQLDWLQLSQQLNWGATGNIAKNIIGNVTQSSFALIGFIGNLVLVPVVWFYLLRDWDDVIAKIGALIPRYYYKKSSHLASACHETLGAFFRGQLMVMLALAVIYSVGLMLIGLDLGLLIGLLAGLASVVPYLGAIVGIGAALVAAFFQFGDITHLVLVAVVFGVGQTLEGTVLTPKFVGDRIGLHPVAVIFAVLAGGQLFGFVGILLALPTAAVIMVLVRQMHDNYRVSELYGPDHHDEDDSDNGLTDADDNANDSEVTKEQTDDELNRPEEK